MTSNAMRYLTKLILFAYEERKFQRIHQPLNKRDNGGMASCRKVTKKGSRNIRQDIENVDECTRLMQK